MAPALGKTLPIADLAHDTVFGARRFFVSSRCRKCARENVSNQVTSPGKPEMKQRQCGLTHLNNTDNCSFSNVSRCRDLVFKAASESSLSGACSL